MRFTHTPGFRTDSETVKTKHRYEKTLVKWDEADDQSAIQLVASADPFDQFEVNSRLGVQANFDEACYTTELKSVDAQLKSFADAQVSDLMRTSQSEKNRHVLEERNLKPQQDNEDDEEANYSAVHGSGAYKKLARSKSK